MYILSKRTIEEPYACLVLATMRGHNPASHLNFAYSMTDIGSYLWHDLMFFESRVDLYHSRVNDEDMKGEIGDYLFKLDIK